MLKRSNLELEIIGNTDQHGNLVLPVAVAMNDPLALQNFRKCLQFVIGLRRHGLRAHIGWQRLVSQLRRTPFARGLKAITDQCFDAKSRARIAVLSAHHVLTKRKFDTGNGALQWKRAGILAPANLDYRVLPTDGI